MTKGTYTRSAGEERPEVGSYVQWWTAGAPHIGVVTSTTKNTAMVRYGTGNRQQHKRFPLEDLTEYEGHAKGKP